MEARAICYFTGTGNSLDIASRLGKLLSADIFFIPAMTDRALERYDTVILVSPVYLFGLPIPVKAWIKGLTKGKTYCAVLHYGGFSGNAAGYTAHLFKGAGLNLRSIHRMTMPENFTIVASPPAVYTRWLLGRTQGRVERIAIQIRAGREKRPRPSIFAFCDGVHERGAAKWADLPRNFFVADACDACGHCSGICPADNIELRSGKPAFLGRCVGCLACYHRCPRRAINYGTGTRKRTRYLNPNVDLGGARRKPG